MGRFEKEFREEMKYTYFLILKYLEIQKEKDKRRKEQNKSNENGKVKTLSTESCTKSTQKHEFDREIRQALGKDENTKQ